MRGVRGWSERSEGVRERGMRGCIGCNATLLSLLSTLI